MTKKQSLKLIVAYDRNRNEYFIAAHNRTPEEAEDHVAQWTPHLRTGCSFIVLDQTRRHGTDQSDECRACRETVARSAHIEPQPKYIGRVHDTSEY